jgi:hypothetical protein
MQIRSVGIAPHLRLIADVQDRPDLLMYSVEIDALTADELIAFAVTDPAHILNAQMDVDWNSSDTVSEIVTVTNEETITCDLTAHAGPRWILSRSWADKHLNSDDDLQYFKGGAVIK